MTPENPNLDPPQIPEIEPASPTELPQQEPDDEPATPEIEPTVPEIEPATPQEMGAELLGELGGPAGPEPTRYGDWEQNGRCSDF